MSERKAINKYYPPDWDPSTFPKKKKGGNNNIKVRLMAPFSMRCLTCNEYIAESRKFNATKEVTNEKYLNFKVIRFHISCPVCNNAITFKTSPQTAGFTPENGAVRNYEPDTKITINVKDRPETEGEVLERLENEAKENQMFQVQKEKRKKDKFWQFQRNLKDEEGDIMENLEKKLRDQLRQQELAEELESLQTKKIKLSANGKGENALRDAQERIKTSKQDEIENEEEKLTEASRNFKHQTNKNDSFKSNKEAQLFSNRANKTILVKKHPRSTKTTLESQPEYNTQKHSQNFVGYSSSDEE